MFGRRKKCKHIWLPAGIPIAKSTKDKDGNEVEIICLIQNCKKCGIFQYIRIPSNVERIKLDRVEEEDED